MSEAASTQRKEKRTPIILKDLKRETIQERVNDLYEEIDRLEQALLIKEADHAKSIRQLEEEKEAHLK